MISPALSSSPPSKTGRLRHKTLSGRLAALADPQAGPLASNVARWLNGASQRIEVARFSGEGLELQDTGTSYRSQPSPYIGTMVRGADLMPWQA